MTERRQLAIGGLLLFVVGTLLVPAMHRLELIRTDAASEDLCHSCCSHEHSREQTNVHETPERSRDSHPQRKPHDPSTCSICQLAKTPVNTAVVAIALPQFAPVEIALPTVPSQPDFKPPRLLPFSCGPPA
jgi:hypothetical protein